MAAAGVTSDIALPELLEAGSPPEARCLRRDHVRLLVSNVARDTLEHARFSDLPRFLREGDTLVVNTSGTLNAALAVDDEAGARFELHLSTHLPGGFWVLEIRVPAGVASLPYRAALTGQRFVLPGGGDAAILAPYPHVDRIDRASRLWIAAVQVPMPMPAYLDRHGFPIRYKYVTQSWPSSMYQTVFATEPGSAEMPSAGRPFTARLVTRLVARGIQIVPVLLHTGVSSLEDHEPPYEEFYRVTPDAASRITASRRAGRRIIAVGTTVVRALETVTDTSGQTSPGEGWTDVVVSPSRPVLAVDGIISGLHEPHASHLLMLEQVVSAARSSTSRDATLGLNDDAGLLRHAYAEAVEHQYLWHEFGDSHLILGGG